MTAAEPLTASHHWEHTAVVPAADDHSVLDRWDRVVAAHGAEPALAGEGRALTYDEADALATALAGALADTLQADGHTGAGVGPVPGGASEPVGIMAGQTTEAVVGVLALIRAGRTVVVLDDHLPPARLAHVVRLAGVAEVLADADRAGTASALVAEVGGVVHDLDALLAAAESAIADRSGAIADRSGATADRPRAASAPDARPGDADPLVLIFTSGSTGLPKGVAVTHRQTLENAEHDAIALGLRPGDRLGLPLPLSFAAGFSYTFNTLLNGGAVVLLDPRDLGVERLLQRLDAERVNGLAATPHLVRSIVRAQPDVPDRRVLGGVRFVVTVGEPVTGTDIAAARPHLGTETTFWNGFGSSEMGCVAYCPVGPDDPLPAGVVPAGWPLPGKRVRVVREDGTPAAPGESGELVVLSHGMTAGYWGAPALTAQHLTVADGTVADGAAADGTAADGAATYGSAPGGAAPYGSAPDGTAPRRTPDDDGMPAWRQGDLARIDPDGRLVLLGRSDDAVKVRGYLVEPSEIEAALRALPDVDDAAVTALVAPPAVTRLVAYVVGRPGRRTPAPAALRRGLRDRLPEYMVPASIVPMTELPRTERGKVDRAALPGAPSIDAEMTEEEYDQWELVVGQIWAEVLGLRGVHLDEDFSALGGDSLTAEEMLAIVHQRLGVDLRGSDVLEHPTLRAFARRVRAGTAALPSHPDVVKVSEARASGNPTVFCFAGAGALALTFLPLSRYLPEYDVYAFQQHALERRGVPDWSIERSARRYLALMRIVQPRGPYLLVGHSLGGLVALEIARMLTEAGERVQHVALLDTYLPHTRAEQARIDFGRLRPQPPSNSTVRVVRRGLDRLVRRVLPAGVPYGDKAAKRFRAYTAGVLRFGGQKDFDAFFDQAAVSSRRYRPTPFTGPTTYVIADENPDADGWSSLLQGDNRTVRIAAEHTSLLREPHVAELAPVLRDALASDGGPQD